jgi:hypothetical protein
MRGAPDGDGNAWANAGAANSFPPANCRAVYTCGRRRRSGNGRNRGPTMVAAAEAAALGGSGWSSGGDHGGATWTWASGGCERRGGQAALARTGPHWPPKPAARERR